MIVINPHYKVWQHTHKCKLVSKGCWKHFPSWCRMCFSKYADVFGDARRINWHKSFCKLIKDQWKCCIHFVVLRLSNCISINVILIKQTRMLHFHIYYHFVRSKTIKRRVQITCHFFLHFLLCVDYLLWKWLYRIEIQLVKN